MRNRPLLPALKSLLLAVLAHGSFTSSARAENRVLFIGNSFTIGSGESVAEIFDALAIAGGQEDPITVMRADGGKDYQWHAGNAPTQAAITSRDWTHVILQNYSTEPTHITRDGVADHLKYGGLLYDQILANNSSTRIILFETWSRAADHSLITGTSTGNSFASTSEMQRELRENYQSLANLLNTNHPANPGVSVAPVGDAWENAGGLLATSHPEYVSLHGGDRYHGNDNGYYLAAAVFYATIYGTSPEGLHAQPAVSALKLTLTEDARFLEQVAWETVTQSGVPRFSSPPQNLTVEEGQSATFKATVRTTGTLSAQWYQGETPIQGATELTYTIPSAGLDLDGSTYTLKVTVGDESITSEPVTLTVQKDQTPPALDEATLEDETTLNLKFNEPIDQISPQSFTIIHQGTIIETINITDGPDATSFTLHLASPVTERFVLKVSAGVSDSRGNAMIDDTLLVFRDSSVFSSRILIDFGASGASTGPLEDTSHSWNNVSSLGVSDTGAIADLISASGTTTGIGFQMVRRFNGANSSGSTVAAHYPSSASGDSLFGNTATFSGLSNVFPAFRLTGFDPEKSYQLTFYASRSGVSDNRETRYTVTGSGIAETTLDPAGNVDRATTLSGLTPDADGSFLVEISPTPANTNSNQFTYLGVLEIAPNDSSPAIFHRPVSLGKNLIIDWSGAGELESSLSLNGDWAPVLPVPSAPYIETIAGAGTRFFRLNGRAR